MYNICAMLGRRFTNVVQMFCVYWEGEKIEKMKKYVTILYGVTVLGAGALG